MKLTVYISAEAAEKLSEIAFRERRDIKEQAGWLLEQWLLPRPEVAILPAAQEPVEYAQQQ